MGNNPAVPICEMYNGTNISALRFEYNNIEQQTTVNPFLMPHDSALHINASTHGRNRIEGHVNVNEATSERPDITWLEIVISILCLLGIIGNILNLLVLNNKRMASDRIGRSMNAGLVALSISDMLFCCMVFPYTFVPNDTTPATSEHMYKFIYKLYGMACINMFMMSSTWIVMFMSVSRYLGVVHPLKAKSSFCTQKMPLIIFLVYVVSMLVTLPYFIHWSIMPCTDGIQDLYEMRSRFSEETHTILVFYIRWVWPVIADFFPLLILVYCNTKLILELHRSTKTRKANCPGQSIRSTNNRVTITLIAVVLMLFIFVSPSEILKYIDPYKSWGKAGHIVATVTNVMQLVNFCSNFLLYCAINPKFRSAAKGLVLDLCCPWKTKHRLVSDRCTEESVSHWKRKQPGLKMGNYKPVSSKTPDM